MTSSCSYMWRAVAKAWPLLCNNMIWSIGNGRTVRCWEDIWVPNVGSLNHYVSRHGNIDFETIVSEMVLANGDWNLDFFRLWLPKEVIDRKISISPPLNQAGPDILSWSRMTSGVFSVKSAYHLLKEETWCLEEKSWNMIWKILGPHRAKHFIWLIFKQRLLTNSERVRRGIT
ncbi:hypothetical protein PVK06_016866 [Gossypium arboreum]|uniref:Reverse transcriptase zinc-binding domain-containing protein n=1 Tax=Gossypium arboreum TaxID=29729 RepID=A0ABR0Q167_GOSAR|nr:hypothetical protein PVK06_016866 [Gossypium arboreum]